MITRLVIRHEILRGLGKSLLVTVALSTFVANVLTYFWFRDGGRPEIGYFEMMALQMIVLGSGAVVFFLGPAGRRCRNWEQGLPLAARDLWQSHFLALVAGATTLVVTVGAVLGLFQLSLASFSEIRLFSGVDLLELIVRPTAMLILGADLVAAFLPATAEPGAHPAWRRFLAAVFAGLLVLLALTSLLDLLYLAPLLLLGAGFQHWSGRRLPGALLAGSWSIRSATGAMVEGGQAESWEQVGPSRRPLDYAVTRLLFKWPATWILGLPAIAFFGLLHSGASVLSESGSSLRVAFFFLTVYMLFAFTGHFMERLHRVDHLPVSRTALLRWLVLPGAITLLLGYGAGRIVAGFQDTERERLLFVSEADNYGLKVPPEFFSLARTGEQQFIVAPNGERVAAEMVPVLRGLSWHLWKPYTTPRGASMEFVSWQLAGAVEAVYGTEIQANELAERYLALAPSGEVILRRGSLSLQKDYPHLQPVTGGPLMPVLVGAQFICWMLCLRLYFRIFKAGITIKRSRFVFWGLMIGLLALHMGTFVTFVFNWSDDWILNGLVLGLVRNLGAHGVGGVAAVWLVMGAVVAGSWQLASKAFQRAEAPRS